MPWLARIVKPMNVHGLRKMTVRTPIGFCLGLLILIRPAGNLAAEDSTPVAASPRNEYVEVPLAGVGCIGGYRECGDTDPENTPATITSTSSSYGWDYRNRSLVVDLGLKKTVNRITLLDNVIDNQGTASNLDKRTIRIYYSDDNRKYARYSRDYSLRVKKGDGLTHDGKPVFDVIDLDKLSIRARYVKLNTAYGGESGNFVLGNTQTAIKAFQLRSESFEIKSIYLENRILTWGRNEVYVDVVVPQGRRASLVTALANGSRLLNEEQTAVSRSGKQTLEYRVAAFEPGTYELSCRIQSEDGTAQAEERLGVKLFSRRIHRREREPDAAGQSRPAAGEIMLIDDFQESMARARTDFVDYRNVRTGKRKTIAVLKPGVAPVKVLLPAHGWCALYVGLQNNSGGVNLQLEGEKERKTCAPGRDPAEEIALVTGKARLHPRRQVDCVTDVFFKYADLKGQHVVITPADQGNAVRLAHFKIMLLTPRQVALVKGERDVSNGKKYVYTQDGYQNWRECNILRSVDKFRGHPEVEAYSWGIGGSAVYYPTRVGTLLGETGYFPRELDKSYVDSLYELIKAGQSPIGMAVQEGHRIGTKVYACYRMNAEYSPPYDKLFNSRFSREHPEYRVVSSQDGMKNPHLSYAFPAVRKYKLDILREVAENYDVDGIHLEFLRSAPYFGYEPPLAEGFKRESGVSVLAPDFKANAAWYIYRARFMTEFMRDLRKILQEVGGKKGKRLWLGARVDYSAYLQQGLDVETWIREGLVDMLAPGVNGLGYPYAPADEFVRMAKGTRCKIYGSTSPEGAGYRDPTPQDDKTGYRFYPKSTSASLDMRRRRCLEYFKVGAQGMYLFNDGGSYLGGFNHLERWGEFEDPLGFDVEPIQLASPR